MIICKHWDHVFVLVTKCFFFYFINNIHNLYTTAQYENELIDKKLNILIEEAPTDDIFGSYQM